MSDLLSSLGDELTLQTGFFAEEVSHGETPPAKMQMALDLLGPRGDRAGGSGFALLWRDRSPHEAPLWRLTVADDANLSFLMETVIQRIGAPERIETDDWITARELLRKRAEPFKLVMWGTLGEAESALLNRRDLRSVYLPLALKAETGSPCLTLPVLEQALTPRPGGENGISLVDAMQLGVACSRVMLASSWAETTCAEKTEFFGPMQAWHTAWLSAELIRILDAWPERPQTGAPWPDGYGGDVASWLRDHLCSWIAETVIGTAHPAHRNAFLAGMSHGAWLDDELQQYLEPKQREEVFSSLLPYCRWFLAMALFNHLSGELAVDPHRDQHYAALVDALPELAKLQSLATQRAIEMAIIRIPSDRAAAAFADLILPFGDLMMAPIYRKG